LQIASDALQWGNQLATPTVPLSKSWQVFWSALFPDEEPLSATLSRWLEDDLVSLVIGKPAEELTEAELLGMPWLRELKIVSSPDGAKVTVGSHTLPNSDWFGDSLVATNDRWFGGGVPPPPIEHRNASKPKSPTDELKISRWRKEFGRHVPAKRHPDYFNPFQELHAASERNIESCMKACIPLTENLTRQIGDDIAHEIRFNLRVGRLTAIARVRGQVQKLEGVEIVELLNDGMQVKAHHDGFESRDLELADAKVQLGPGSNPKIKMPLAFDAYDDAVFDRMKDLLANGRARSVSMAAELMAKFALARSSKSNGVKRRLETNFSNKYPNLEY
jgi:hypothetical protein